MGFLINTTDVYRVDTVEEVEALHEELTNDSRFTLTSFSYKTKYIKEKGDIIEEYQLVTAKKVFNNEKEPDNEVIIDYRVGLN